VIRDWNQVASFHKEEYFDLGSEWLDTVECTGIRHPPSTVRLVISRPVPAVGNTWNAYIVTMVEHLAKPTA
jgi:hypothetical protein